MTLSEAALRLGVYQPTLSRWIIAGLVRPDGWMRKQGKPIEITERELRMFAVVRDLRNAGVDMDVIRGATDVLSELDASSFGRGQFIVVGNDGSAIRIVGMEDAVASLSGGQLMIPMPRDPIKATALVKMTETKETAETVETT